MFINIAAGVRWALGSLDLSWVSGFWRWDRAWALQQVLGLLDLNVPPCQSLRGLSQKWKNSGGGETHAVERNWVDITWLLWDVKNVLQLLNCTSQMEFQLFKCNESSKLKSLVLWPVSCITSCSDLTVQWLKTKTQDAANCIHCSHYSLAVT